MHFVGRETRFLRQIKNMNDNFKLRYKENELSVSVGHTRRLEADIRSAGQ